MGFCYRKGSDSKKGSNNEKGCDSKKGSDSVKGVDSGKKSDDKIICFHLKTVLLLIIIDLIEYNFITPLFHDFLDSTN